jgi:Brp/Blh family beta-carotene 15,15'-monooxygenase
MTALCASAFGWGALFVSAAIAAWLPLGAQAGYAAALIAVLGLPHGAADLALVERSRRPSFLVAYLGTILAVVLFWRFQPVAALVSFLAVSFVHFATDGRDGAPSAHDWAVAAALVAGPAVFHRAGVATLFDATGASDRASMLLSAGLAAIGLVAVPVALSAVLASRDGHGRATETAALATVLLAPPLVGFALGFVVLHAREQTVRRQNELGMAGAVPYLRHVAPTLAGAAVVLAGLVAIVPASPAGIEMLFASIAALAMPHMLVTPVWRNALAPRLRTVTMHEGTGFSRSHRSRTRKT